MQNNHSQSSLNSLNALPQRSNGKLPPLISKYHWGLAQTRNAPDRSPKLESRQISGTPRELAIDVYSLGNSGLGASNPSETPSSLPPRQSPTPSTYSFSQSPNPSQLWQLPGSPPSAPPVSQLAPAPYNPSTYGLTPSARQSPVNPARNQSNIVSGQDASTWGVKHNQNQASNPSPVATPSLPVRLVSTAFCLSKWCRLLI